MRRPQGLQNDDDHLRAHRAVARVRRAGWIFIAVVLAAGLAGAFGSGALSRSRLHSGELRVELSRIVHAHTPTEIEVRITDAPRRDGLERLRLDGRWLDGVEIESVSPEPENASTREGSLVLEFRADPPARIGMRVLPLRPGVLRGTISLNDGPPSALEQWVLP
jgi:hypothetical protein